MKGILNIYKLPGMTSHDVVNKIRRTIGMKKVGHTGTLDPLAEGVLPICIGEATKISQFIIEKDKEYITELLLGSQTDTYDKTGSVTQESNSIPLEKDISQALEEFEGDILQVPPIYSAIKVSGKKLYEYARENKKVEIQPRKITIHTIVLLNYQYPVVKLKIHCSKGTYIRSICNDLGEKLGSFAHMSTLIRTKSGPFCMEKGIPLDDLDAMDCDKIEALLYPMDYPLNHLRSVGIKESASKYLLNGNTLVQKNCSQDLSQLSIGESVRLYLNHQFKGIGEITPNYAIKTLRIFK
ncbi:MAG: tRNA pseudouridine(55) synthase TruB [Eubacteriales bacterium]